MRRKALKIITGFLAVAFIGIQAVPVDRSNPPVIAEPDWNAPATRALAVRACFNCHSNETRWPWYSRVAPVSWLVTNHVREGREHLNFSEWPSGDLEAAAEEVERGAMPLRDYLRMHPDARLTADETDSLIAGLLATDEIELKGK